jgi:hypothetical protein
VRMRPTRQVLDLAMVVGRLLIFLCLSPFVAQLLASGFDSVAGTRTPNSVISAVALILGLGAFTWNERRIRRPGPRPSDGTTCSLSRSLPLR